MFDRRLMSLLLVCSLLPEVGLAILQPPVALLRRSGALDQPLVLSEQDPPLEFLSQEIAGRKPGAAASALAPAPVAAPVDAHADVKSYSVELLRTVPHVGRPWTQGLEFSGGQLIETSGDYPRGSGSFVRVLDPASGAVVKTITDGLGSNYDALFIEGITALDGKFFASTFQNHQVVEYDSDLNFVRSHTFPHVGWGLTHAPDHSSFIATNGSEYVMLLEPGTFELRSATAATCMGKKVSGLNELEMVDNFFGNGPALLGNVINTRLVLVLDPSTFQCLGTFHLQGLEATTMDENMGFHVANGIAYNSRTGNFWVTGKNWDSMYEIRLSEESAPASGSQEGALRMLATHLNVAL